MASNPTRRLRNALQLALLADNDHEALAALRAVQRVLEAQGRSVEWLLNQVGSVQTALPPPIDYPAPRPHTWQEAARWLQARAGYLDDHELAFIDDMARKPATYRLTPKQFGWLHNIYRRVQIVDVTHAS
jgi:hypothetical protein